MTADTRAALAAMFSGESTAPGRLITISGFDGAGKTTQIEALSAALRRDGEAVLSTYQPTDTYRADPDVRSFLDDGASPQSIRILALMAAVDRLRHVERVIKPALRQGQTVICDRYVYATLALFVHRGLDLPFVASINTGVLRPDVAVHLDVPATALAARLKARDGDRLKVEERSLETIEAIGRQYETLGDELIHIDGNQPPDDVAHAIYARCRRR